MPAIDNTLSRPRVLVLEPDASARLACRQLLDGLGVDVLEAADGPAALALAREHTLLLCLITPGLPEAASLDAARALREVQAVPLLFMALSHDNLAHRREAYRLGAVDYLAAQTCDEEWLRLKLSSWIAQLDRRRQLELELRRLERDNQLLFFENEALRVQQEDAQQFSTHDAVTLLPNRLLFEDRLRSAMHRAQRAGTRLALLMVDIDDFAGFREAHGPAAAERLLVAVSQRLRESLRASDTLARLGADEFGVLMEGVDSQDQGRQLGRKLRGLFAQPLALSSGGAATSANEVSVSIGVALYPDHAASQDELLMLADLAMYQSRQHGSGVKLYQARTVAG